MLCECVWSTRCNLDIAISMDQSEASSYIFISTRATLKSYVAAVYRTHRHTYPSGVNTDDDDLYRASDSDGRWKWWCIVVSRPKIRRSRISIRFIISPAHEEVSNGKRLKNPLDSDGDRKTCSRPSSLKVKTHRGLLG